MVKGRNKRGGDEGGRRLDVLGKNGQEDFSRILGKTTKDVCSSIVLGKIHSTGWIGCTQVSGEGVQKT